MAALSSLQPKPVSPIAAPLETKLVRPIPAGTSHFGGNGSAGIGHRTLPRILSTLQIRHFDQCLANRTQMLGNRHGSGTQGDAYPKMERIVPPSARWVTPFIAGFVIS